MPEKYETAHLQHLGELACLLDIFRREKVTRYLEIGSKFGGSLWKIATELPRGSRIVSVDLPRGDTSFKDSEPALRACIDRLRSRGYDSHLILGDSTDKRTVEAVRALGPYDAVFIDACHILKYIWADWHNYGPMAPIVAFHDIGWKQRPLPGKKPIEVPIVWEELKKTHRHQEFCLCERDNGIGVLWR